MRVISTPILTRSSMMLISGGSRAHAQLGENLLDVQTGLRLQPADGGPDHRVSTLAEGERRNLSKFGIRDDSRLEILHDAIEQPQILKDFRRTVTREGVRRP